MFTHHVFPSGTTHPFSRTTSRKLFSSMSDTKSQIEQFSDCLFPVKERSPWLDREFRKLKFKLFISLAKCFSERLLWPAWTYCPARHFSLLYVLCYLILLSSPSLLLSPSSPTQLALDRGESLDQSMLRDFRTKRHIGASFFKIQKSFVGLKILTRDQMHTGSGSSGKRSLALKIYYATLRDLWQHEILQLGCSMPERSTIRSEVCLRQFTLQWNTPPGMVMLSMTVSMTVSMMGVTSTLSEW